MLMMLRWWCAKIVMLIHNERAAVVMLDLLLIAVLRLGRGCE